MTRLLAWPLLVLLLLAPRPDTGAAQASAVDRARHGLQSYDLEGSGTTRVIADLSALLQGRPAEGPTAREARFLRSMAAADLLLLAEHHGTPELRARVARAYGVAPTALAPQLDADLAALEIGVYAESARDARHALAFQNGRADPTPARPAGARGDLFRLGAIRRAAAEGEPLRALARLADDPCPEGPRTGCSAPYTRFGAEGRRAIAAAAEHATQLHSHVLH